MLERRTKIVATLGPATDARACSTQLVAAGLDCARLNCSHGDADDLRRRAARGARGGRAGRPAAGPAVRPPGAEAAAGGRHVERARCEAGETVVFSGDRRPRRPDRVCVDFAGFARLVTERSEIVIGDGVPRFAVERVDEGEVVARVVSPGPLSPRKGINVTYARPELPAITDKDVADLELAAELGADFVALSFVRSAADLEELRARLRRARLATRASWPRSRRSRPTSTSTRSSPSRDGVMVARGDYGVEAGVARVPLMQKDTILRATQAGKLVITATQMLESMIQAPEPTRAEAADVANAVIDGTSAVMLSAETSVGDYPVEAVRAMAEIAEAAEEVPEIHGRAREAQGDTAAAAVMHAAVELADEIDAAALVVPTATGGAARACAKYRRRRPIIALAHEPAGGRPAHARVGRLPDAHAASPSPSTT